MNIQAVPMPGFTPHRRGHNPLLIVHHVMLGSEAGTRAEFAKGQKSSNYAIAADGTVVCYVPVEHSAWANGNLRDPNLSIPAIAQAVNEHINPNDLSISIEWAGAHTLLPGAWITVPWRNPATGAIERISTLDRRKVRAFWQPTPAQWAAGLELTRQLCAEWRIPADREHILRHSDWDSVGKWFCPGDGFDLGRVLTELSTQARGLARPDPRVAALEAARHELTTLHGLWAHDGHPTDHPAEWQIDTRAVLEQIDAALKERN